MKDNDRDLYVIYKKEVKDIVKNSSVKTFEKIEDAHSFAKGKGYSIYKISIDKKNIMNNVEKI